MDQRTPRRRLRRAARKFACVSVIFASACAWPTEGSKTVLLRFQGVVTAADGRPIADASVSIDGILFVWQTSLHAVTTDASGRYRLEYAASCTRGQDLYQAPGSAHLLVVRAAGYENRSSVNIGRQLFCVTEEQTVDFVLDAGRVAEDYPGG
jgi:hypothetical protein